MKILLALSGGVDSALAAHLLLEQGHTLEAVFLTHPALDPEPAKQAARELGIPLHIVDIADELEKIVIADFEAAYLSGRTPNPCVVCNPAVKFAALIKAADELGCSHVATGHYVVAKSALLRSSFSRRENDRLRTLPCSSSAEKVTLASPARSATAPLRSACEFRTSALIRRGSRRFSLATNFFGGARFARAKTRLFKSPSPNDQSYMLCRLSPAQLARCIFPLGGLAKDDVRRLAAAHGLSSADKPDSMDICFVPDGDYAAFLRARGITSEPGDFVDEAGRVLGRHRGLIGYTVGQRRGLGVSADERLYVKRLDPTTNSIILVKENQMYTDTLRIFDLRGVSRPLSALPSRVRVKVRHSRVDYPAAISLEPAAIAATHPTPDGKAVLTGGELAAGSAAVPPAAVLTLETPIKHPAPGQFAAIYVGDELAASGVFA